MLPVAKLPVSSHALISIYRTYSRTCWILGKDYHSSYRQWHAEMCGRFENCIFVFDRPTW